MVSFIILGEKKEAQKVSQDYIDNKMKNLDLYSSMYDDPKVQVKTLIVSLGKMSLEMVGREWGEKKHIRERRSIVNCYLLVPTMIRDCART